MSFAETEEKPKRDKLSLKECWDMAKTSIDADHQLVEFRIRRFLTLQGFLFTIVIAVIGAYFYSQYQILTLNPVASLMLTWLFAFLTLFILFVIYVLAYNSAALSIISTRLAKLRTYFINYWFWCHKEGKMGLDGQLSESEYWLVHHENRDYSKIQGFDDFFLSKLFLGELTEQKKLPGKITKCEPILGWLFRRFGFFQEYELDNYFRQGNTKLSGTTTAYARIIINAWQWLFYGILIFLFLHVVVCTGMYCLGISITTSKTIIIDKLPSAIQGEPVVKHESMPQDSDKEIGKNNSGNSSVTYHLFENAKFELHLHQSEKTDSKPLINHDDIDKLLNHLKMLGKPDELVPAQCVTETPETSTEEPD